MKSTYNKLSNNPVAISAVVLLFIFAQWALSGVVAYFVGIPQAVALWVSIALLSRSTIKRLDGKVKALAEQQKFDNVNTQLQDFINKNKLNK